MAVWGDPDPSALTLTGAAVRSLLFPQLFVALPDGTWKPLIVAPGSSRLAADHRSASFKILPGAAWSDGSPIGAADLRRTADANVVAAVDDAGADGTITVHFSRPLVGWERLWSGTASIAGPRAGVFGGPFTLLSVTPGLEVKLRRNDRWVGGGPFLDEVDLVAVPDAVTARQLLAKGDVDVVMPLAGLARTSQLRKVSGARVMTAPAGGWWDGLDLSPSLAADRRRAVVATVDRDRFRSVLLAGEAVDATGLAGPDDTTWKALGAGSAAGIRGATVTVSGENEDPMTSLLERAMQKRAGAAGGTLELRNSWAADVEGWLGSGQYQVALSMHYDGPSVCWTCRFGSVDAGLAQAAEAGDGGAATALEAKLRAEALIAPLWRPLTVVAVRADLEGVQANGYGLSAAWNAADWWRSK